MDERLRRLSDIGDQLEGFAAMADFEVFRPELDAASPTATAPRAGRPPFDPVMMFKILMTQACNDLSDDRAEFLSNDRLSFMRFLGLGLTDKVPDAKTIRAFRERLTRAGAIKGLFARFDRAIRGEQANATGPREPVHGYIPMAGQIVDASLISVPRQRNTEAEKVEIIDHRHGFIRKWDVTDASRHDGRMLRRGLIDATCAHHYDPATDSMNIRPPIPRRSGRPFHGHPATLC